MAKRKTIGSISIITDSETSYGNIGDVAGDFRIMIRQANNIYKWCETGDWLLCGKVKQGIDGAFIEWFA